MRERRSGRAAAGDDPFGALGLPWEAGLSDDDVRAAWRRVAAATHPDRDDGGDPSRFGAAAAAYAALRTAYGRGEALADLADARRGTRERHGARGRHGLRGRHDLRGSHGLRGTHSLRGTHGLRRSHGLRGRRAGRGDRGVWRGQGRLGVLMLRVVGALALSVVAVAAAGWSPACVGVVAGALTWLVATGRHDLPARARDY